MVIKNTGEHDKHHHSYSIRVINTIENCTGKLFGFPNEYINGKRRNLDSKIKRH